MTDGIQCKCHHFTVQLTPRTPLGVITRFPDTSEMFRQKLCSTEGKTFIITLEQTKVSEETRLLAPSLDSVFKL